MSSPISSTLMIIFILSILLLLSTPGHAASSSALIKKICAATRKDFNVILCERVLQSEPRVASTTNLFDMSVGIIKAGISRSKNTRRHIKSLMKRNSTDPDAKGALQGCKLSYDWVIGSLNSGLGEVNIKEYETATYDLLLAGTDCIRNCESIVGSKVIKDKIIVRGNKLVRVFGLSAYEAVSMLPYKPPT